MRALVLVQKLAQSREEIVRMAAARALAALGSEAAPAAIELTRLLEYGDPPKMAAAAFVLSEIGPRAVEHEPRLVDALIERMAHQDPDVRHWSVVAIARLGAQAHPAIPALIQALSDADEGVRLVAAHALGEFGETNEEAVEPLLRALQDRTQGVRSAAAKALGLIAPGSERLTEALTCLLSDPVPSVRAYAAEALGNLAPAGDAAAVSLRRCLGDESPEVRAQAAEAMGKLPSPSEETVRALTARLDDPDGTVRVRVVDGLRQLGGAAASALPLFIKRLRDHDETVRFHSVEMLEVTAPHNKTFLPAALLALTRCLHDESTLVVSRASMALRALSRLLVAVDASLFEAIGSADESERLAAAEAVRFFRQDDPGLLAALRQQLRDLSPAVRAAACVSLAQLARPSREILPTLMAMMNDSERPPQIAAIKALGEIASRVPECREILDARRNHADPVIQAHVQRALALTERREDGLK